MIKEKLKRLNGKPLTDLVDDAVSGRFLVKIRERELNAPIAQFIKINKYAKKEDVLEVINYTEINTFYSYKKDKFIAYQKTPYRKNYDFPIKEEDISKGNIYIMPAEFNPEAFEESK